MAYEAFQGRDFITAQQLAHEAWNQAEQLGDRRGAGYAAANRGAVLAISSQLDEALKWYETAAEKFPPEEPKTTIGRLAAARAYALRLKNENDLALVEIEKARAILGIEDWRIRYATAAIGLWTNLDIFSANDKLGDLLKEAEASGDANRVAVVLQVLGWSATAAQWYNEALRLYQREIDLSVESGNPRQGAFARRNIGAVYVHMCELLNAQKNLNAALQEARRLGDQELQFIILNDLSIAYAQADDQQRARTADVQAAEILARIGAGLRRDEAVLTPSFDYYHLARMRVLNQPTFLIDPFPWLLDQLALEPTGDEQ